MLMFDCEAVPFWFMISDALFCNVLRPPRELLASVPLIGL